MGRTPIPDAIQTEVLLKSKRRCCLCSGLFQDYAVKIGQIAHIDQNNSNNKFENLAFLCLEHHSTYDSKTKQHKNYKPQELKHYRNELYKFIELNSNIDILQIPTSKINKPFVLLFDGTNETAIYRDVNLKNITNFIINGEFKIGNNIYDGPIICLNNEKNEPLLFLQYFGINHVEHSGEITLVYQDDKGINEVKTGCLASNLDWINFELHYENNKCSLTINNSRVFSKFSLHDSIHTIQLAGRGSWKEIGQTSGESTKNDYVGHHFFCYFKQISLYNLSTDVVLFHFNFEYGKNYFTSLPNAKNLEFINMDDYNYYKTNKC